MLIEIGKIPYTNRDAEASKAICHKSVYIRKQGSGYTIQVAGLNSVELPNASKDREEIVFRAKKFIRRNKGSVLKKPKYQFTTYGQGWPASMLSPVTPADSYSSRKKKRKRSAEEQTETPAESSSEN